MFFQPFPKLLYNQNFKSKNTKFDLLTDIFFRTKFKDIAKNENVSYYLYSIRDHDTLEGVAYKYYGDPQDHWIIMYANDIVDPYYDWPLSTKNFNAYIIEKYGSLASAKTTVHHYNKVVETTDSSTGEITTRRYEIDETDIREAEGENLTPLEPYDEIAEEGYYINPEPLFADNSAIAIRTYREAVTQFDWENELNENKREIRLLHKNYYNTIKTQMEEFFAEYYRQPFYKEVRNY